ncbi:MAG TPA: ATP-dependent Clp protease proteolytic subunit [Candidatus Lokiarchaeia archaeon]
MKKKSEDIAEKIGEKYTDDYYFRILNKERYILLYSEIEPCSAEMIVAKIKAMNYLSKTTPITLEINSPGGNVADGLAIIDTMMSSLAPIYTIITGEAASMAGLISIVGAKRFITKNGCWMMHSSSDLVGGFLEHIKDRTNFLIKLEKKMDSLLHSKTTLNKKQFNQIKNGELWLFSEECKQYGIVDDIL